MATSSRQSAIFGANDWKAIYKTFSQADFKSYDYETLRKTFIDYLRTYYPETFNDYIESSEFIALLDVISFMGQGLAFRNDLNARENFIDTAERRDSVIKLANLISYNPKRNLTANGYLKITSIRTSENITDLNGVNLSNLTILWNDPANNYWLEQFNTIINAALVSSQRIGKPANTQNILGVTTSEYTLRIPSNTSPVVPFSIDLDGRSIDFELVSASTLYKNYVYEISPLPTNKFNILSRNDNLGYGSPNSGYFFYFKQGNLRTYDFTLDQQIDNRVVDIDIQGINNTDTWLYELSTSPVEEWTYVDDIYSNNNVQIEGDKRKIFTVISRANDQVSYAFGDGVFSQIPIGTFRSYVRSSNGLTYSIDPTDMRNIIISFNYVNKVGRTETLTLGLSLQLPVTNAQSRETIANIKQRAPTRYYTQNRMVNGEDCSNFPYTLYSSIIKSKAINKSSVGVSKNLDLLDPTGKYSSTTSFANDGALWQEDSISQTKLTINNVGDILTFLSSDLSSILSSKAVIQHYLRYYAKYDLNEESGDRTVYWKSSTVDANSMTGYFYNILEAQQYPIPVGSYASYNAKYITPGAILRFDAPFGYYFNETNKLIPGTASNAITTIYITVLSVITDGYNNGRGNFPNGLGPITVNGYVPTGAILKTVVPSFSTTLPAGVIQECTARMELKQSFSLLFDNSLSIVLDRWFVDIFENPDSMILFEPDQNYDDVYSITFKSLKFFFGSVKDTRFIFDRNKVVYDPLKGSILQDSVDILITNTKPESSYPLDKSIHMNIIGQTTEKDGYINDYNIEVTSNDDNNSELILDPYFFDTVTGFKFEPGPDGVTNTWYNKFAFVFFQEVQDAINLTKKFIVPTSDVIYIYPTKTAIELVKYEYPVNQIYYAYDDDKFYKAVQVTTVETLYYVLETRTDYSMKPGRQGLQFQYKHNSPNTTRIDPATTNIIDLYVVTQSYYTQYTNWLNDTTGTIEEPNKPTINELSLSYSSVNEYKMMSDSLVLNSVNFKPLFGKKADPLLQSVIKVIKASDTKASISEIKSAVLSTMNEYFDIGNWNFGDTFYFSELSAYLHKELGDMVSSVVLVPKDPTLTFGDLYEIKCLPHEIFVNGATADDISVITSLTSTELQQNK